MNYQILDGRTEKIGEALAATAKVYSKDGQAKKVYFKLPGSMGTITYDIKANRWYGASRLVPSIKKAFELE